MSTKRHSLAELAQVIQTDPLLEGLDCYIVGGAVRDCLLQQPVTDKDWVVVGVQPQTLSARGFVPVGADFPVFLHPQTHEEFALARTERKQGRGYHGFVFYTGTEVRLEDDLARRDLTINAMAVGREAILIDPFGGAQDIVQRQLRHVGPAFAEDPVRLLRLARFLARFPDFEVATATVALARQLVEDGEVDALVAERVWQEWQRGLLTSAPERMFDFLSALGALARISPQLQWSDTSGQALRCAAERALGLMQRFALLLFESQSPQALAQALRAPKECVTGAVALQRLALDVQQWLMQLRSIMWLFIEAAGGQCSSGSARPTKAALQAQYQALRQRQAFVTAEQQCWAALYQVLIGADALRRPQRFHDLVAALGCVGSVPVEPAFWVQALAALQQVDTAKIASQFVAADKQHIPLAIAAARQNALQEGLGMVSLLSQVSSAWWAMSAAGSLSGGEAG